MIRIFTVMLILATAGMTGCHHCGDRPHLFSSNSQDPCGRTVSDRDCREAMTASTRRPGVIYDEVVPNGSYPTYPSGPSYPVYPSGPAITPNQPSNELPYPRIPAPGVPETPAQPMPASPSSNQNPPPSRTTAK